LRGTKTKKILHDDQPANTGCQWDESGPSLLFSFASKERPRDYDGSPPNIFFPYSFPASGRIRFLFVFFFFFFVFFFCPFHLVLFFDSARPTRPHRKAIVSRRIFCCAFGREIRENAIKIVEAGEMAQDSGVPVPISHRNAAGNCARRSARTE